MKPSPPASPFVVSRVAAMMFLQYATLGLWVATVGTYIDRNTGEQGLGIFGPGFVGLSATAGAIGAIFSPLVLGVIADRYLATEKLLSGLHLICAGCVWLMAISESQGLFYVALLVYFQAYAATATLTSSLAFRQLPDAEHDFAVVRAIGTAGWIVAGVFIGWCWPALTGDSIEATVLPLKIAAGVHVVMTAYCLTLPHTPATGRINVGWRGLTGGSRLWSNRPFLIFLAISILAAAPTQFYNSCLNLFLNRVGYEHAAAKMTLGQATEVFVLLALPALMVRFEVKTLFLVGALGWAFRFALLAAYAEHSPPAAYLAIVIHGFCFSFVYMTGQYYADRLADRDARGAAQGLHTLATLGIGHLIGAFTVQWAQATYLTPEGVDPIYDWRTFWFIPAGISLLAAVLFAVFFNGQTKADTRDARTRVSGPASDS